MASIYCAKTTASRDEKHLRFAVWCVLYYRFYGIFNNASNVRFLCVFNASLVWRGIPIYCPLFFLVKYTSPHIVVWRRHRSLSTIAQVMSCCLTAPSNYLIQCWFLISEVFWHSHNSNFTKSAKAIIPSWKIILLKSLPRILGTNELIDCNRRYSTNLQHKMYHFLRQWPIFACKH